MSTATEVKTRPILFSAPMVEAILAGRKTQTRRFVKHQGRPLADFAFYEVDGDTIRTEGGRVKPCPYGVPGDRLWLKETWAAKDDATTYYKAGSFRPENTTRPHTETDGIKWKSGRYMPRRRSRRTLELTGVRVERVQDISNADLLAEGIEPLLTKADKPDYTDAVLKFQTLWDKLNGVGSWNASPWVWALTFRVLPAGREAR